VAGRLFAGGGVVRINKEAETLRRFAAAAADDTPPAVRAAYLFLVRTDRWPLAGCSADSFRLVFRYEVRDCHLRGYRVQYRALAADYGRRELSHLLLLPDADWGRSPDSFTVAGADAWAAARLAAAPPGFRRVMDRLVARPPGFCRFVVMATPRPDDIRISNTPDPGRG
jgi:hypothetical protein